MKTRQRVGDSMVSVSVDVSPAVIDFDDILEAIKIEGDSDHSAPWQECDGWEHYLRSPNHDEEAEHARGAIWDNRERRIIELEIDGGWFEYARQNGASKQTAREYEACMRRQCLDQLKDWHENGWAYYYVHCDYLEASAAVGGVDDWDYAYDEVRKEIAEEVAHELEKEGYTIEGMPDRRAAYLENRRMVMNRRPSEFTWRD